jgi:hypothetical protein
MSVRIATGGKAQWSANGTAWTDIPEVRRWTLRITSDSKQYASSSTNGGKRRIAGAEDFDGSVEVYHDATARVDAMGIKGGVTGYLRLWEDATDYYQAPVYVETVDATTDIEGGEIIGGTIAFQRDGALIYPT